MDNEYKEDLRVVRSRNLLCKAFFELLEVMPFEKITVIDICNKAMVHRATFYNHFEDKEHLLTYAIDQIQEDMFNATIEKEKYATPKEMYMHESNPIEAVPEKSISLAPMTSSSR